MKSEAYCSGLTTPTAVGQIQVTLRHCLISASVTTEMPGSAVIVITTIIITRAQDQDLFGTTHTFLMVCIDLTRFLLGLVSDPEEQRKSTISKSFTVTNSFVLLATSILRTSIEFSRDMFSCLVLEIFSRLILGGFVCVCVFVFL